MDNQKAKMLGENLAHYKRMQENGTVDIIEFHTTDGQKPLPSWNASCIQPVSAAFRNDWRKAVNTRRPGNWNRR